MYIDVYTVYVRKHDKKPFKVSDSEEGMSCGGLFRMEQNISQSVCKCFFFKQHCAAVVECSYGMTLTEWQSYATLWMKLCLISSWMQSSQIHTEKQSK